MAFASLDSLLGRGMREPVEVVVDDPPPRLVASRDIVRRDALGRTVIAVPRGQAPASWVQLTDNERASLVPAPPRPPAGYLHANGWGFTPEGVTVGIGVERGS